MSDRRADADPSLDADGYSPVLRVSILRIASESTAGTPPPLSVSLVTSHVAQKVELTTLSDNERVLFFTNTYNVAVMHAIIVRGPPGRNLYERTAFMRNSKYNVGGFVFSLVELEHGILRASSSSPMLFGRFSASMAFAGKPFSSPVFATT